MFFSLDIGRLHIMFLLLLPGVERFISWRYESWKDAQNRRQCVHQTFVTAIYVELLPDMDGYLHDCIAI
jgi:hypothetical protein